MKTLAALILVLAALPAFAQAKFPEKPLRLVVPFAADEPAGIIARLVAGTMAESMGQPIVVENKPGAGGTIAATEVARSAPDGYTLMIHSVATAAINLHLYKKLPYDPVKDFQPISRLADIPAQSLREFRNADWVSIYAKGGTPPDVIRKLEMEAIKAVNDPMVLARIRMLGAIPVGSTAEELDKFWRAEIEYWRPIVARLNLQLD